MTFVVWNDTYSVNVAEIDQQHQKLLAIMNELYEAMQENNESNVLREILDRLVTYTETHFNTEKEYFDQYGYPNKDEHNKTHTYFKNKISDFRTSFTSGETDLSFEVMTFLKDWLRNHIKGVDKEYSEFFNEKGLK